MHIAPPNDQFSTPLLVYVARTIFTEVFLRPPEKAARLHSQYAIHAREHIKHGLREACLPLCAHWDEGRPVQLTVAEDQLTDAFRKKVLAQICCRREDEEGFAAELARNLTRFGITEADLFVRFRFVYRNSQIFLEPSVRNLRRSPVEKAIAGMHAHRLLPER